MQEHENWNLIRKVRASQATVEADSFYMYSAWIWWNKKNSRKFSQIKGEREKALIPCSHARKRRYLLWIGSGPLGTFLLLLLKGSSPSLRSCTAPIAILLPPTPTAAALAGVGVFTSLSTTNDMRTRPPSRMATAEAANASLPDNQAGLLIILCHFQFLLNFALPQPPAASYELLMEWCN